MLANCTPIEKLKPWAGGLTGWALSLYREKRGCALTRYMALTLTRPKTGGWALTRDTTVSITHTLQAVFVDVLLSWQKLSHPKSVLGQFLAAIFCPMGQNVAAKKCPRTLLGCNIQSRLGQNCPRTNSVYLPKIVLGQSFTAKHCPRTKICSQNLS